MNGNRITIGATTALLLVVLRVAIGWHFFYEGVWKSQHSAQFALESEGSLSAARGPLAPYYNRLVPDIDGRRRLQTNLVPISITTSDGATTQVRPLVQSWEKLKEKFVDYYKPVKDSKYEELHKALAAAAQKVFDRHVNGLDADTDRKWKGLEPYLKEVWPQMEAHFASLNRFEESAATDPATAFQKERRWNDMQDYRKEAKTWIAELDAREGAYKKELLALVAKPDAALEADAKESWKLHEADRKKALAKATTDAAKKKIAKEAEKDPAPQAVADFSPLAEAKAAVGGPNAPFGAEVWNRLQWMSFGLMCTLLAVGFCLMLGLFTRPAALVGAGFLVFVVMAQPSFPGVYPTDPPQLGHALFINKDYVEMIALLVLASSSVGRWGGLDYFIGRWFIDPFMKK